MAIVLIRSFKSTNRSRVDLNNSHLESDFDL